MAFHLHPRIRRTFIRPRYLARYSRYSHFCTSFVSPEKLAYATFTHFNRSVRTNVMLIIFIRRGSRRNSPFSVETSVLQNRVFFKFVYVNNVGQMLEKPKTRRCGYEWSRFCRANVSDLRNGRTDSFEGERVQIVFLFVRQRRKK